jgi:hypothetical protein
MMNGLLELCRSRRPVRAAVLAVGLLLLGCGSALAHGVPARQDERTIAGYHLLINQYADPARVEQALPVTVSAAPDGPSLDGASLSLVGRPGLGTDGVATRAVPLIEEPFEPGSYAAEMTFSVAGSWEIEVQVDGPAGSGAARVPVVVAAPSAIPVWLGWLIGLSPLAGLAWFGTWNRRELRRLLAASPA